MAPHSGRQFNERPQRVVFSNIRVQDVRHPPSGRTPVAVLRCCRNILINSGIDQGRHPLTPESTTYSVSTSVSTMASICILKRNILPGDHPRPAGVIFSTPRGTARSGRSAHQATEDTFQQLFTFYFLDLFSITPHLSFLGSGSWDSHSTCRSVRLTI